VKVSGSDVGFKGGFPFGYLGALGLNRTHVVPNCAVPLSAIDLVGACLSRIDFGLAVDKPKLRLLDANRAFTWFRELAIWYDCRTKLVV